MGHKADFVVVHFRPTLDDVSRAERQFEQTALAAFTEQPTSYVSVTEVSGYVSDDYFEGEEDDRRRPARTSGPAPPRRAGRGSPASTR